MAELVDALLSGSSAARRGGSSPLLGTIKLQDIDKVDNLPLWGSINRACYTSLLYKDGPKASVTIEKTTKNRSKDCYTRLLHNVPSGLCVRSGRFYYRRRVPHDIRQLIGRAEIWRSLQTDSAKAELPLCKINPLQAKRYAQSRGKRAKTDAVDAAMLARMGHEHSLEPKPILSQAIDEMKELSVARLALIKDRTAALNRKHARRSLLLQRQLKVRITQINKQIGEIDAAIAAIIATQPDLKEKQKILLSIPGIGPAAVRSLIIDMPELSTIENGQAASLVGVAPIPKESGTYKGQSRIGGGRAHVREALFMPALGPFTIFRNRKMV
jgi:hypothetical protein